MTECREWQGSKLPTGYGRKYDKVLKIPVNVHRWVVAQIHGWDALEGMVVMHTCDNPSCYRYDHLRIATQSENIADRDAKRRQWNMDKTHCKHGHPFDEENTYLHKGRRVCRECVRASGRKWKAKQRDSRSS